MIQIEGNRLSQQVLAKATLLNQKIISRLELGPFEFTKNYKFTVLNNENVWAKAANRVLSEKSAGRQGG